MIHSLQAISGQPQVPPFPMKVIRGYQNKPANAVQRLKAEWLICTRITLVWLTFRTKEQLLYILPMNVSKTSFWGKKKRERNGTVHNRHHVNVFFQMATNGLSQMWRKLQDIQRHAHNKLQIKGFTAMPLKDTFWFPKDPFSDQFLK